MKPIIASLLLCLTASAADIQWQDCNIESGGHTLKIGFKTDISTNDVGYWERKKMLASGGLVVWGSASASTNAISFWYHQAEEKPFPRTSVNENHWEVYSNTYAIANCDGQMNTLSESHVKLGDLVRKETTVIVAATNTVSTENFTPVKK